MEDPIGSHPTRAEQLDILATVIADSAAAGDRILDFGCGTGYVAKLIFDKRADLNIVGVDLKPDSLEQAKQNLAPNENRFEGYAGNLESLDDIGIPDGPYRFALTALHNAVAFAAPTASSVAPGAVRSSRSQPTLNNCADLI